MKLWLTYFAFVFILSCTESKENAVIYPFEKELIYDVQIDVHSATPLPVMFASTYNLKAKLHIQGLGSRIIAYLTDIHYLLSNGKFEHKKNDSYLPIPNEADALNLPFQVRFDSGKLDSIEVVVSDVEWSVNIKKSIASSLQIKHDILLRNNKNGIETLHEQTIYGDIEVSYQVNTNGSTITLLKTFNIKRDYSSNQFYGTTFFADVNSTRHYTISQKNEHYIIDQITIINHALISPHKLSKTVFGTVTYQQFSLSDTIDIKNQITLNDTKFIRYMVYNISGLTCDKNFVEKFVDITAGRRKYNPDVMIEKVNNLLSKYADYFDSNQITFSIPHLRNVTLFQNVLPILETFNLETFEKCYATMPEIPQNRVDLLKRDILVHLLPYIGTRASARFLANLVIYKKLPAALAADIIVEFPNHLRCVDTELLTDIEGLLTSNEDNIVLHQTSVLGFAKLVRFMYETDEEQSPELLKYVDIFINKFSEAKEYQDKILYLEALSNIQVGPAFKFLKTVAAGELAVESNFRTLALYGIAPALSENLHTLQEIVLPILANRQANIDLRLAAYNVFMKTEKPTLKRFMELYDIMKEENNEKFYSFHYKTLKALSELECSNPEKCKLVKISKEILTLSRKPLRNSVYIGTMIAELIDNENGRDINLENMLFTRTSGFTFRAQIKNNHFNDLKSEEFSIYLNSEFKHSTNSYELIIKKHSATVFISAGQNTTITDVKRKVNQIVSDLGIYNPFVSNGSVHTFDISQFQERIIVNDLGQPIRIYEITPVAIELSYNVTSSIRVNIKMVASKTVQSSVYNPINDLWHGVQKVKYFGIEVPLTINFERIGDTVKGFKFIFDNPSKDIISAQKYVKTQVFIEGDDNKALLAQFNPNTSVYRTVTKGDSYRKDVQILSADVLEVGKTVDLAVYDCKENLSNETFNKHLTDGKYMNILSLSGIETCGVRVQLIPMSNISSIEFLIQLGMGIFEGNDNTTKYNFVREIKTSLQVKDRSNKNLRSYDHQTKFKTTSNRDSILVNSNLIRTDGEIETSKINLNYSINSYYENIYAQLNLTFDDKENNLAEIYTQIIGSYSPEEWEIFNKKQILFSECKKEMIAPNIPSPVTSECLHAATSLRQYSAQIDMKTNGENYCLRKLLETLDKFLSKYTKYEDKILLNAKTNAQYHIDLIFPVCRKDEIDITILHNQKSKTYTGIPYWEIVFSPFNIVEDVVSQTDNDIKTFVFDTIAFVIFDSYLYSCTVTPNYVITIGDYLVKTNISSGWQSLVKNNQIDIQVTNGQEPKSVALEITIKNLRIADDKYEIFSRNNTLVLIINGKEHELISGKDDSVSNVNIWSIRYPKMLHLYFRYENVGIIFRITFDGESIILHVPSPQFYTLQGICVDENLTA